MKINSPLLSRVAATSGLMLGAFALSVLAQSVWTAPTAVPPNNNTPAPINVGDSLQIKTGSLQVGINTANAITGAIVTGGLGIFSSNFSFKPSSADVTPGYVLTAKDAAGTIDWTAPTGGPGSGLDQVYHDATLSGQGTPTNVLKVVGSGSTPTSISGLFTSVTTDCSVAGAPLVMTNCVVSCPSGYSLVGGGCNSAGTGNIFFSATGSLYDGQGGTEGKDWLCSGTLVPNTTVGGNIHATAYCVK